MEAPLLFGAGSVGGTGVRFVAGLMDLADHRRTGS